jgi:large subunit ribosomal protein L30
VAETKNPTHNQKLVVTLKRSMIGTPLRHRLVLRGLRLRRPNQSVTVPDTAQVRGMIHKVNYLLEVTHQ